MASARFHTRSAPGYDARNRRASGGERKVIAVEDGFSTHEKNSPPS
ncbi:hypothetical protein KCP78_08800 [Salmonella enterica subsp. enterica]|nr:hypothetical protein KCP78_08800 [Salmonella enterica subsp. enterica]